MCTGCNAADPTARPGPRQGAATDRTPDPGPAPATDQPRPRGVVGPAGGVRAVFEYHGRIEVAHSAATADEDPGHENEVRVTRTVRGRTTEGPEPLLSPCVPVLEDPFHV
ncbi:hypothetical protein GCM10010519_81050 [Streptomyces lactacystinicus]